MLVNFIVFSTEKYLKVMRFCKIPKKIIKVVKELPPWLKKGNGMPTTGAKPMVIETFTPV